MSEFISDHIRITLSLLAQKILENDCILSEPLQTAI